MKLYVDLDTFQLIEAPGFRNPVSSLRFKRGDSARLEVSFLDAGIRPTSIGDPQSLEIQFGVKPRNRYDIGYLVHDAAWTMPATGSDAPVYLCSPNFNTIELDSALGLGASTGSELPEITLMGEITWREGQHPPTSTRTFLVVVENDVNRGTEGIPLSAQPAYPGPTAIELTERKGVPLGYAPLNAHGRVPEQHLPVGFLLKPEITQLEGTTLGSLSALPTTTLPLLTVVGVILNDALSFYQLQAGTAATEVPGIIRPNDYHAATNPRCWKQVL